MKTLLVLAATALAGCVHHVDQPRVPDDGGSGTAITYTRLCMDCGPGGLPHYGYDDHAPRN